MGSYDIETFKDFNNYHTPYCIVYIFKKSKKIFYYNELKDIVLESINSIFCEKLSNNNKNIIYIHNLDFDGILILNSITKNNFEFKIFMRKMSIYSIKIIKNNKIIEFRCSYKILPSSLKNIANSFSLNEKLIFPYNFSCLENLNYIGYIPEKNYFNSYNDYENFKKKNNYFNFKEISIEYCSRDVEITLNFIKILRKICLNLKINLESSISAPSLSLKIFLKKFNNNNIKVRYNDKLDKYLRNSYFGGHTNVYGNPKKNEFIYYFDYPGMYSLVMKEKFPIGNYKFITNNFNLKMPGFYFIDFYSEMNMPVLPHHREKDNKLMFTNGNLSGIYWNEEINLFLENGGKVKKIHYAIIFEKYDYCFNNFLDFFQNLRNKGGEYKTFSKLIVNSLYGRLGMQKEESYTIFVRKEDFDYYNKKYEILSFKDVNDYFLLEILIKNSNFFKKEKINENERHISNVAIASCITSKARIKLYKSFENVIKNNGRILYTDTDSIFAAYEKKVDNEKHGEVEWNDKNKIKDAVFISPKAYSIKYENNEELTKIKGITQKNIKFDEIKENFYKNKYIYINNFNYISTKEFKLQNFEIKKKFDLNNFDKRKFIKNKKETESFFYDNWKYY